MLPEDGSYASCSGCGRYGGWANSGEIDIMEIANTMQEVRAGREVLWGCCGCRAGEGCGAACHAHGLSALFPELTCPAVIVPDQVLRRYACLAVEGHAPLRRHVSCIGAEAGPGQQGGVLHESASLPLLFRASDRWCPTISCETGGHTTHTAPAPPPCPLASPSPMPSTCTAWSGRGARCVPVWAERERLRWQDWQDLSC